MQIVMSQYVRVQLPADQFDQMIEPHQAWKGEPKDNQPCHLAFLVSECPFTPEQVVKTAKKIKGMKLLSFTLAPEVGGCSLIFSVPPVKWATARAKLIKALGPVPAIPVDTVAAALQFEDLELTLGYGLVRLVEEIVPGLNIVRRRIAEALGWRMPSVRVRDSITLAATQYVIRVRGTIVANAHVLPDKLFTFKEG